MTFGESVRYCLAHLNDYQGRARRSEFWWYYLALSLAGTVVSLILTVVLMIAIFGAVAGAAGGSAEVGAGSLAVIVMSYAAIFVLAAVSTWLLLAAQARRLHDAGYSAHFLWFYLAGLSIVPLVLCVMDSQPHANEWGPDPKAGERAAWGYPPPAA